MMHSLLMALRREKIGLVVGRTDNIKVTYPSDLALAQFILTQQGEIS